MTTVAELSPKFADQVVAAQSVFRTVMDAMARPGSLRRVRTGTDAPAPMMRGTAAIALTLFDHDTPIWLDPVMSQRQDVAKWLKFHTSAPIVDEPSVASFALVADAAALPALDRFALGSGEYPDRSTTVILQLASLTEGPAVELRGPGIDGATILRAALQPSDLIARLAQNYQLFPRGVDLVLVADDAVVALPRTTRLVAQEG